LSISSLSFAQKEIAVILNISGGIGPASADYFKRGLDYAIEKDATLLILKLDTPGGLDKSMRVMIKDILNSPIPVISYVSPSGARAASAGTYILYASHIAAMAPGTNLGAATPVNMMGGNPVDQKGPETEKNKGDPNNLAPKKTAMEKKVVNDATAYIQGLAKLRGRNVAWATVAVREGKSIDAELAAQKRVIDFVASSLSDLLTNSHGKTVKLKDRSITLNTKNLSLERQDPDWRSRFLSIITSPDVAYVLLLIGAYGLFFEFSNPGFVLPGVLGGISLLLALYALQMLPISYAGLSLIALGLALLISEAFIPSFGVLGIGGTIAFIFGSILLMEPVDFANKISLPLIIFFSCINLAFFFLIIKVAISAFKKPIITGDNVLIGSRGKTLTEVNPRGQVFVQGEIWKAESDGLISKGSVIQVIAVKGLSLLVKAIDNTEQINTVTQEGDNND
tara:strand:- start:1068 stop:2423 length:1356 start_codon:yes stop_codon:yes gene_type:complete